MSKPIQISVAYAHAFEQQHGKAITTVLLDDGRIFYMRDDEPNEGWQKMDDGPWLQGMGGR